MATSATIHASLGSSAVRPPPSAFPALRTVVGREKPSAPQSEGLNLLDGLGVRVSFARNETIFNEGDLVASVYRVEKGAVRLLRHMPDGRRQIADFRLDGDFFGLVSCAEYTLTAEAVSDTVLCAYPRRQVEALSEDCPSLRRAMTSLLCDRLAAMQTHLVVLGRQTAEERMASFLLMLVRRIDAADGECLPLPMSRQDIADYLGLTIETVSRLLSGLKRKHIVDLPSLTQIVLRDIDALQDIAESEL